MAVNYLWMTCDVTGTTATGGTGNRHGWLGSVSDTLPGVIHSSALRSRLPFCANEYFISIKDVMK